MDTPPLNPNFIFNNKMPKCGGTSLKYILYVLSEDNDFYMDYQAPCIVKEDCAKNEEDGTDGRSELVKHLKEQKAAKPGKYFLLKHHHWLNFTEVGMDAPTYINVVRDPGPGFDYKVYLTSLIIRNLQRLSLRTNDLRKMK